MIKLRNILKKIKPFIDTPEAVVITGMRRTGKTSLLKLLFESINSKNKIFIDLENPLNRKYFEELNYERIKKTFELLGLRFGEKAYVFLDEIQFVRNIPSIVKYFIDHYNVKFFLTGSASFYLKNLFSESLAGRKVIFELFPLSFEEFLLFKDVDIKIPKDVKEIDKAIFETISLLYEEYIMFGGFPQVVLRTDIEEKKKMLEEIFTSYFLYEVTQFGDFRKNKIIRDLILLLVQRVGSRLDIQKLSKELGVARQTVCEYLDFLEGTYFISLVRPFSKDREAEIRKAPKVYFCDSGVINYLGSLEPGKVFENNVFQNLRLQGTVNYYQKKTGQEIDFIIDKKIAYEVQITAELADIKKLGQIARDIGIKDFRVVSKNFIKLLNENLLYGFML